MYRTSTHARPLPMGAVSWNRDLDERREAVLCLRERIAARHAIREVPQPGHYRPILKRGNRDATANQDRPPAPTRIGPWETPILNLRSDVTDLDLGSQYLRRKFSRTTHLQRRRASNARPAR